MILVDRADGARLRELFLALLPDHPDLELYTDPRSLLDLPEGTTLVLAPSAEHADWLNISRPLFAERSLRVILWCDAETSKALARRATDFFDWISHRVECPPGVPAFAVEGLRCALLARAPGVIWRGEHFQRSFDLAFPRRHIRWLTARALWAGLAFELKLRGSSWLGFNEIEGELQLSVLTRALGKHRGRVVLSHPAAPLPGWHLVHDRLESAPDARQRLKREAVRWPGRLAVLAGLEPESLDLVEVLLAGGVREQTIAEAASGCGDPGVALAWAAAGRRLIDPLAIASVSDNNPPWLRAFAREPEVRRRRYAAVAKLAPKPLSQEDVDELLIVTLNQEGSFRDFFWTIMSSEGAPAGEPIARVESRVRNVLSVLEPGKLPQQENLYITGLTALAITLAKQARFEEAESVLRQALSIKLPGRMSEPLLSAILTELSKVLAAQGRQVEAELLLAGSRFSAEKL